jgi:gas vesicle protein
MMNTKKILMGVLAGAATGAVLGLVFAPEKGKSTIRRIMDKGETYLSRLEQILDGYVSLINDKMENLKADVADMGNNGTSKVKDTTTDVIHKKTK